MAHGIRAAEAAATVEALKLQMAKRKLQASSNSSRGSRVSQRNPDKHADKYLRPYHSPEVGTGMADGQHVDPNGPCPS